MGIGFASWSLFLIHLLIFMCVHGSGVRELTRKHSEEIHAMDDHPVKQDHDIHDQDQGTQREHVHAHPSSHMDDMDPSSKVFFTMKDQMVGETMPIYFRKRDFSTSPRLLPREEADSIPFSLKQLPNILEFFSFSPDSPQAKSMEYTLRQCETEPIKGETKICATSMESLLDFTRGILGSNSHFQVLTTSHLTKSNTLFQNYTFLKMPEEIPAPKMVACHNMPYPYAVFYCHSQAKETKVFKVALGGENGDMVEAVTVCHTDTSRWSHDHASFRVLGIKPGTPNVCHFFPADNLVWVPKPMSI
ncbi:BURP domain-containing protein BNM2A-like [Juglans microcarpa x Juglans regia]|uniref:BURP domain-containing protein BNM2A-like n=1 Tax=Juglans microcarpa x Juglans regia TaxID=2249226 RepID=UPI001B7D9936|nr:BURP domain-containing protein BNM2A-like [Juglans microcarpa x Juglans regia]XP_041013391.1 BURP domain-containing protein BNM2A-like [Juglans microcarpa x Juglans regia]